MRIKDLYLARDVRYCNRCKARKAVRYFPRNGRTCQACVNEKRAIFMGTAYKQQKRAWMRAYRLKQRLFS